MLMAVEPVNLASEKPYRFAVPAVNRYTWKNVVMMTLDSGLKALQLWPLSMPWMRAYAEERINFELVHHVPTGVNAILQSYGLIGLGVVWPQYYRSTGLSASLKLDLFRNVFSS